VDANATSLLLQARSKPKRNVPVQTKACGALQTGDMDEIVRMFAQAMGFGQDAKPAATPALATAEAPLAAAAGQEDDGRVLIMIQYCEECGFAERAEKAKDMLYEEFPATVIDVRVEPHKARGAFEMLVDGKLLHSKLQRPTDGFFHTNARQQVLVLDAI